MPYLRNGFTPASLPSEHMVRRFRVSAGAGESIAQGDAVSKSANTLIRAGSGQDPTNPLFGVVIGVYNSANAPFTFSTTKFIASGTAGYADVCYDPDQEYIVRCETSVGDTNIAQNVTIDQSAPNAVLGRSGQAVAIPASASINDLFKIVAVSPGEPQGSVAGIPVGSPGNGVIVRVNRSVYHAATAGAS